MMMMMMMMMMMIKKRSINLSCCTSTSIRSHETYKQAGKVILIRLSPLFLSSLPLPTTYVSFRGTLGHDISISTSPPRQGAKEEERREGKGRESIQEPGTTGESQGTKG
jgi:hypothetical protein